jgi:Fe-S-cluster containining protein
MVQPIQIVAYTDFADQRLARNTAFAYQCNRCSNCCRKFRIPVGPFDLLQLADILGVSTTAVIRDYLADGFHLKRHDDGSCVFLGSAGCTVHAGRPMVCRVYPLGRNVSHGEEWFSVLHPVANSAAVWGKGGTVADYLEQQGATPSIDGLRLYTELYMRMAKRLTDAVDDDGNIPDTGWGAAAGLGLAADGMLDPDPTIMKHCRRNALPVPRQVMEKARCHINAIDAWLDNRLKELK